MRRVKTTITKIGLILVLSVHVGMHILYLAPINPATSTYESVVTSYMNSFFSQNWHLFAPEPATASLDLEYRCSADSSWISPLQELFKEHKVFPLTARGKQTYVLQNLAREIFNGKIKKMPDSEIKELEIAHRFLRDQCGSYSDAELQVKRTFTQDYSKRLTAEKGPSEIYGFKIKKGSVAWSF